MIIAAGDGVNGCLGQHAWRSPYATSRTRISWRLPLRCRSPALHLPIKHLYDVIMCHAIIAVGVQQISAGRGGHSGGGHSPSGIFTVVPLQPQRRGAVTRGVLTSSCWINVRTRANKSPLGIFAARPSHGASCAGCARTISAPALTF